MYLRSFHENHQPGVLMWLHLNPKGSRSMAKYAFQTPDSPLTLGECDSVPWMLSVRRSSEARSHSTNLPWTDRDQFQGLIIQPAFHEKKPVSACSLPSNPPKSEARFFGPTGRWMDWCEELQKRGTSVGTNVGSNPLVKSENNDNLNREFERNIPPFQFDHYDDKTYVCLI